MRRFLSQAIVPFILSAVVPLTGCNGIFSDVYDEAEEDNDVTVSGELYIDASSWTDWHFIDLEEVAENTEIDSLYNPSSAWVTYPVPVDTIDSEGTDGIYTYWYDVFGEGLSNRESREFYPTAAQQKPDNWTFAVHRNNVMTNGCSVTATDYDSFDQLPDDITAFASLSFDEDVWNESDVWVIQERMLLGLIGCQGIEINETLSSWLKIDIPPMPPAFTLNSKVFILKTQEGKLAALQLKNYQSSTGTKCVLSINYRYPL
ncbi:MAG: HmuY family protein [Prevotellaceae bacterium]|nr:HmuY family protein [Prevotellaceae bacterium]